MKLLKTVCIIILLFINEFVFCQDDDRFLFIGKEGGETDKLYLSRGLNAIFLNDVTSALLEKLPCVDVSDPVSIEYCLSELRLQSTPEFGKRDVVPIIKNISTAISNGYKVRYSIYPVSDEMVHAEVKCEDKKGNVILDFSVQMNIQEFATTNRIRLSEMFIDKLSKYEICPYKGEISITVVSTIKDEKTEEYRVDCNKTDGVFKRNISTDNYTESDWKIIKTGKNSADGFVKIDVSEKHMIEEVNPCYACAPDKQGPRNYKEETTTSAHIRDLSKESESYGVNVDDARVYLTFLDDGTYTIRIKAASTQSNKTTIKTVTAQGICDNSNDPPEKITNKVDVGLNEIWGPFKGNGQDKTLLHKDTIKRTDPITKEETTITYEFNLTRE